MALGFFFLKAMKCIFLISSFLPRLQENKLSSDLPEVNVRASVIAHSQ